MFQRSFSNRILILVALMGASELTLLTTQAQVPIEQPPAPIRFDPIYSDCVGDAPPMAGAAGGMMGGNLAALNGANGGYCPPDGLLCGLTSPTWQWTFLPQGFLYHTYWASAAEPRLSTQIFESFGDGPYLDSSIAGRIGFVRFGERYSEEGFQIDLLVGAKLRQDVDDEMDMVGTDYRYDIPLTYRRGQHAWKFGFYHVSSHTGDEFLIRNPGYPRLNYYRDSLYLGYSYYMFPELRLYGEMDYAFSRDVSKPWQLQFGFDYGPVHPTRIHGAPFFALNVHLREEVNWGGNVNIQGGWAWRGEGLGAGTLRTGPYFYNGKSPQFSFYNQSEQQLGWGLWYDF